MPGHKNFQTLIDKLPPERRARSDVRVAEIRRQMLLAELRERNVRIKRNAIDRRFDEDNSE